MTECKFIPGTLYKDRDGCVYKFLVLEPEADVGEQAVFLNTSMRPVTRCVNGHVHVAETSPGDIIPTPVGTHEAPVTPPKREFKVGEMYLDDVGNKYKCIALVPEAQQTDQAIFLDSDGDITSRSTEGRFHTSCRGGLDIIPDPVSASVYKGPGMYEFRQGLCGEVTIVQVLGTLGESDTQVVILDKEQDVYIFPAEDLVIAVNKAPYLDINPKVPNGTADE